MLCRCPECLLQLHLDGEAPIEDNDAAIEAMLAEQETDFSWLLGAMQLGAAIWFIVLYALFVH